MNSALNLQIWEQFHYGSDGQTSQQSSQQQSQNHQNLDIQLQIQEHQLPLNAGAVSINSNNNYVTKACPTIAMSRQKASDEFPEHSQKQRQCYNCFTSTTPLWRRFGDNDVLCNACGLYQRVNGTHRPVSSGTCVSGDETIVASGIGRDSAGVDSGLHNDNTSIDSVSVSDILDKRVDLKCMNCGTRQTSMWRRNAAGKSVCNACGLYYRLNGVERPLEMRRESIRTRKRRTKPMLLLHAMLGQDFFKNSSSGSSVSSSSSSPPSLSSSLSLSSSSSSSMSSFPQTTEFTNFSNLDSLRSSINNQNTSSFERQSNSLEKLLNHRPEIINSRKNESFRPLVPSLSANHVSGPSCSLSCFDRKHTGISTTAKETIVKATATEGAKRTSQMTITAAEAVSKTGATTTMTLCAKDRKISGTLQNGGLIKKDRTSRRSVKDVKTINNKQETALNLVQDSSSSLLLTCQTNSQTISVLEQSMDQTVGEMVEELPASGKFQKDLFRNALSDDEDNYNENGAEDEKCVENVFGVKQLQTSVHNLDAYQYVEQNYHHPHHNLHHHQQSNEFPIPEYRIES